MKNLEIEQREKHEGISQNQSLLMILRDPMHDFDSQKISKSFELEYWFPDPEMNSLIVKSMWFCDCFDTNNSLYYANMAI